MYTSEIMTTRLNRFGVVLFFGVVGNVHIIQRERWSSEAIETSASNLDLFGDTRGLIFYKYQDQGLEPLKVVELLVLYFRSDHCVWCSKLKGGVMEKGKIAMGQDEFLLGGVDIMEHGGGLVTAST
jgi:hypothetical protein